MALFLAQPDDESGEIRRRWQRWLDPVFLAGVAFLVLLVLQWWNAGRDPYFHPFEHRWVFTPPPHPGFPSAVDRAEASEMLRWFFPAWALMLVFQRSSGMRGKSFAAPVAWFLIINAALLSVVGIAQLLSGTSRMFWFVPMHKHFFASFGYENHAASYFPLHAGLAAGMLIHTLHRRIGVHGSRRRGQRSPLPVITAAACTLLCLVGAVLSFSRAGIAFAVALTLFSVFCAAHAFWFRITFAQRIRASVVMIMCTVTVFFVTAAAGGRKLAGAAGNLVRSDDPLALDTRVFLADTAIEIWKDSPWVGSGGWGFRHFGPIHALEAGRKVHAGYANVHNDALQFLCEFGLVGMILLLISLAVFLRPLWKTLLQRPESGILPVIAGLGAVLAHSMIDLPFRSPGIMYAWLAVAGVAARCFQSGDAAAQSRSSCG